MKGVERLWTGCSYFFLLMADRGEDATSARSERGGRQKEDRKRAKLNDERERERGKEKRREWIDSSTSMIPVKSLTDGNF